MQHARACFASISNTCVERVSVSRYLSSMEHRLGDRAGAGVCRVIKAVKVRPRRLIEAAVCVFGLLFALPGCTLISKDGPEGPAISADAVVSVPPSPGRIPYAQVAMSPLAIDVADRFSAIYTRRFGSFRNDKGVSDVTIGAGDVVSVTVFEAESGGLFVPKDAASRPGNFVQIPNQQVDSSGNISVPYVEGKVHVVGRRPDAVSREISSKLKARAIEPQAVVSVVEHRSNDITVLGDVAASTRFSLDPGGIRLTEAIARAGGPKNPSYEERVDVKRRGVVQSAELSTVVKDPSQDLLLRPGDLVYVERRPRIFMVFGATPPPGAVGGLNNRRFTFEDDNMSLAEGVAKAGGLDNLRASPDEFFLLRFEAPAVLSALGVDPTRWVGARRIPVVYKVNLNAADGFFLASKFYLRDQDVIFVGEALNVSLNKVLQTVDLATGAFYDAGLGAVAVK